MLAAVVAWIVSATALNLLIRFAWPEYTVAEPAMSFTLSMMLAGAISGVVSPVLPALVVFSYLGAASRWRYPK